MKQHSIVVPKTARYFQLGECSPETRHVWFVCHGYGQLASYFLKKFEAIVAPDTVVIAPEGLHRFYTEGFSGRIGASWMTKEDRLDDIRDYVSLLSEVHKTIMQQLSHPVKVHVLGFSQGGATVTRWLSQANVNVDTLVLWCAFFPPDVTWEKHPHTNTHIVLASDDVFISKAEGEKQLQDLREAGVPFTSHQFEGKHTIDAVMLQQLAQRVYKT